MLKLLIFCFLLVTCWPLALAAVLLYPVIWLTLLPFRAVGLVAEGAFHVVEAMFLLPVRLVRSL